MCSLHPEATGIEDALNKHIRNGKKKNVALKKSQFKLPSHWEELKMFI